MKATVNFYCPYAQLCAQASDPAEGDTYTLLTLEQMRKLSVILLVLAANHSIAQYTKLRNSVGLTGGTLNSSQSIASGLSVYLDRNLLTMKNASFSLSTRLVLGTEDKTGLVFPAILILLMLESYTNTTPDLSSLNINAKLFSEFPLMLHYNYGLGSGSYNDHRFGFYFGAGLSYMLTGYTDTAGIGQSTSFFGYKMDFGVRFHRDIDINLSQTISLQPNIGQIHNPAFYQLTISKSF